MRDDPSVVVLVAAANQGDQQAWDQIVERYAGLVWATCKRYGLNGAESDDVGAAVWLRLVERLTTIRDPAALPGWLATTARNECLHLIRARKRYTLVPGSDIVIGEPEPAVDEWLLAQERLIALRVAFAELSKRCRDLLSLLFNDSSASYAQISARIGMKVGAIGPTRMRCLDELRRSASLAALLDSAPAPSPPRRRP